MSTLPLHEWWYEWGGLNLKLFRLVYGEGTDELSWLLPTLDAIGEYKNFPYLLAGCTVMLMAKLAYRKLIQRDCGSYKLRSYLAWLVAMIISFVVMAVIVAGLKEWLALPRPYMKLDDVNLLYGYKEAGDGYRSFPSGHVAFTALWVALLWRQFGGFLRVILFTALVAMCWFRLAIGAHFPVDVLVSLFIGIYCATTIQTMSRKVFRVWN